MFTAPFITETPVSKSGQGYSGAPRIQRQEQVIHLSPKKGSQVRIHTSLATHSVNYYDSDRRVVDGLFCISKFWRMKFILQA